MILYFTGTGNSHYIAQKIADVTRDEMVSMNGKIKEKDNGDITVNGNLIIVTPTYAWRIPHIVRDWILNTHFIDVKNVWFVMDCGAEIGNADKYNRELCEQKDFHLIDKKPVWENNCTHCMACINHCPTEAVEYGKKSIHKERYTFDKLKLEVNIL